MDYQKVRSARPALGRIRGRIQLRSENWFLFLRFANCTTKKMWSCSPHSRRIRWNVSRQQGRQPAELSGEFVPLGGQEALISRGVERLEFVIKSPLFGCQTCGNCVLGQMEYVCPQTCPKNMRNGPCGGTKNGQCEVVDKPCIWTAVFERAKSANRLEDLRVYIPSPIRALKGTSSWVNYFLGRDSRPENVPPSSDTRRGPTRAGSGDPGESTRVSGQPPGASSDIYQCR